MDDIQNEIARLCCNIKRDDKLRTFYAKKAKECNERIKAAERQIETLHRRTFLLAG